MSATEHTRTTYLQSLSNKSVTETVVAESRLLQNYSELKTS